MLWTLDLPRLPAVSQSAGWAHQFPPGWEGQEGWLLLRHSHIFTFPSAATAFDGGLRWADAPSTWFPGPKKTLTALRYATCTTKQG